MTYSGNKDLAGRQGRARSSSRGQKLNADEVKKRRGRLRLEQEPFAEKAGISLRTLQRVETGKSVGKNTLIKLVRFLKCKPADLLPDTQLATPRITSPPEAPDACISVNATSRLRRLIVQTVIEGNESVDAVAQELHIAPALIREWRADVTSITDTDTAFVKTVHVLNCGGTIDSAGTKPLRPTSSVLRTLQERSLTFGPCPAATDVFERPPDSSSIGECHWAEIVRRIEAIAERKESIRRGLAAIGIVVRPAGIVVTHGTDTLAATSFLVGLELFARGLSVPVVFTGSHAPIADEDSDGLANLRKSIQVVTDSKLPPAVYVLIGQDIHLASRLTKVRTRPDSNGKYFYSFPAAVGRITGTDRLAVDNEFIARITGSREGDELAVTKQRLAMGLVEHLVIDHFTDPACVRDVELRINQYRGDSALAGRGIGVVIQGDFSRNPAAAEFISRFSRLANIPVLIGSQNVHRLCRERSDTANCHLIPRSLTHTQAQLKLRWLLRYRSELHRLFKLLDANVIGEIHGSTDLPEWINYETFPDNRPGTEIVVVYPDIRAKVLEHARLRLERSRGVADEGRSRAEGEPRLPTLYLYGFGAGHIPAPNESIGEIVDGFLREQVLCGDSAVVDGDVTSLEQAEEAIVKQLRLLVAEHAQELHAYVRLQYKVNEAELRSAFRAQIGHALRQEASGRLCAVLDRLERFAKRTRLKNLPKVKQAVELAARFNIEEDAVVRKLDEVYSRHPATDQREISVLCASFPKLLARRLIKDALMSRSALLREVGLAVDAGIRVKLRTLAVRGWTDTAEYEVGQMLQAVGAESQRQRGCATTYLVRRVDRQQ